MSDPRTIPIRIDHLGTVVRYNAALWCIEEFGIENFDFLRPITVKMDGPNPCNEIGVVACFWFAKQEDANWFALKWL
jgi:hypothetical protein